MKMIHLHAAADAEVPVACRNTVKHLKCIKFYAIIFN